jgi:thymidylate synthase ThyX
MKASLVYDGTKLIIPESMGTPCDDQMQGTVHEQLGELACRICYDSLGVDENGKRRGRSSAKLHEHILEAINLSVYEHINYTVTISIEPHFIDNFLWSLINRKGIWIEHPYGGILEITCNLRSVLEWEKNTRRANSRIETYALGRLLSYYGQQLCPQIIKEDYSSEPIAFKELLECSEFKEELTEDQAHISMYLSGSRGFSAEQNRHRFSVSQRSTRYCDESKSPYIEHPLITKYLKNKDQYQSLLIRGEIDYSIKTDRSTYNLLVNQLQTFLQEQGLDKTSARKQARGAARGYLGNAIKTEMIFTAPVSAWRDVMLQQRCSDFADAEIRMIYNQVLPELQRSQYGSFFNDMELVPAKDGIGEVLK